MILPRLFKPKNNYKLKRLGKDYDGGYVVCYNSIKKTDLLISIGIYDDWSFEKHFKDENNKIKINMYDKTLSFKFLIRRLLVEFIKLFIPGRVKNLKYLIRGFPNYFFFVRKNFKKQIINKKNFKKILNEKEKNIFLKIDIEGSEYNILDTIIKNKSKIEGIVIEFHDIYEHLKEIKKFIQNINLKLVNISPNNFQYNNPRNLEFSFSRKPKIINKKKYNFSNLNIRNDPRRENINLEFK